MAITALVVSLPALTLAAGVAVEIGGEELKVVREGSAIFLLVKPARGDGFLSLAQRFAELGRDAAPAIRAANPEVRAPQLGRAVRIPLPLLRPDDRGRMLEALFPADRTVMAGRIHDVGEEAGLKDLEGALAAWFTGHAENRSKLRAADGGELPAKLKVGDQVLVPAAVLDEPLKPPPLPSPAFDEEEKLELEFGADDRGTFALYRLRAGEALYSAVVVRFTGRIHAADVNELAAEIACRSGIDDVTDIPIGFPVRIPLDLVMPDFLPSWDWRRREVERSRLESARYRTAVRTRTLGDIHVILDPGHGGNDVGTSHGGIWEATYVYDIYARLKKLLEERTEATVWPTVEDGRRGFSVPDEDRLSGTKKARVLTDPPYDLGDATTGVHLRWYLANSRLKRLVDRGGSKDKVVFLSLHADSLHPSLRGAMAYVPGERFLNRKYGKTGPVYEKRREWHEVREVEFSAAERFQSEGYSRDLAEHLLEAFRRRNLPVHPYKPIRENVIRRKREWVPAVLRYNKVPARVLLEVCNLGNPEDRSLMLTREYRQEVAEAILDALLSYYDGRGNER